MVKEKGKESELWRIPRENCVPKGTACPRVGAWSFTLHYTYAAYLFYRGMFASTTPALSAHNLRLGPGAGPHSRILTGVDKPLSRQNTENVLRSQSLYLITSWLLLKIHILFDYSIIPTATLSYCSIHIMHISFSPMYYLARLLKSRLLLHDFRNKVDVHRVSDSFEFASWHINGHWPSR